MFNRPRQKCINLACDQTAESYGISPSNPDNTAATNAAIQSIAAAGGGTLEFDEPGTYNYLGEVVLLDGVTLQGLGPDVTILDFSNSNPLDFPDGANIYATGSLVTLPTISVAIARGNTSITFASAPALSIDDVFILENTTDNSWSQDRTYYHAGEFFAVRAVTGSVVDVQTPSFDDYLVGANISVWRMDSVRVSIKGFSIVGNGSTTSVINVQFGRGCVFEDLDLTGSQVSLLSITRCFDTWITRIRAADYSAAIGYNYGVAFGNSQLAFVTSCSLATTRHGFTCGGDDQDGAVPCRSIIVDGCQITGSALPGCDVHGNSEDIMFKDCEVDGGFDMGGVGHSICDCRVWADTGNGFCLQLYEVVGYDWTITGNKFYASRDISTSSTYGLLVHNRVDGGIEKTNGTMLISDNTFDMGAYDGYPLYILWRDSDLTSAVVIENNVFRRDAVFTGTVYQVAVDAVDGSALKRVVMRGNTLAGCGLLANRACAEKIEIDSNHVYQSMDYGIRVNSADPSAPFTTYEISVLNNNVDRSYLTGIYVNGDANATQTALLRNNTSLRNNQSGQSSVTANGTSITVNLINSLRMQANSIGDDQGTKTQIRSAYLTNITEMFETSTFRVGTILAHSITSVTNRLRDVTSILRAFTPSVQVSLDANWGTGATVANVSGINCTEVAGAFEVTAGTTPGVDPVLTFTFPDGLWPIIPVSIVVRNDNAAPTAAPITWTTTTSQLLIQFRGTPVDANVYRFYYHNIAVQL